MYPVSQLSEDYSCPFTICINRQSRSGGVYIHIRYNHNNWLLTSRDSHSLTRLTAQIVSLSEAAPTQFAWPVFASLEILPNRISPFRVFDGETFEFKQQSCRSRLIFGRKREKRREEKYEPLSSSIDTNRFSALYVIITSNAAKEFRTLSWRSGNGGKKKEREAKRLEKETRGWRPGGGKVSGTWRDVPVATISLEGKEIPGHYPSHNFSSRLTRA